MTPYLTSLATIYNYLYGTTICGDAFLHLIGWKWVKRIFLHILSPATICVFWWQYVLHDLTYYRGRQSMQDDNICRNRWSSWLWACMLWSHNIMKSCFLRTYTLSMCYFVIYWILVSCVDMHILMTYILDLHILKLLRQSIYIYITIIILLAEPRVTHRKLRVKMQQNQTEKLIMHVAAFYATMCKYQVSLSF